MFRIYLSFHKRSQRFQYLDSINAALIAGLTATGILSNRLIGAAAAPWTFGVKGWSRPGGDTVMTGLTVSTTDADVATALAVLDPAACVVNSANGDRLDFAGATVKPETRGPAPGVTEMAVGFASPFVVMKPKTGREKTVFYDDIQTVALNDALRTGLSARAGRDMDVAIAADPLTLAVDGARQLVATRRQGGRRILIPAFSFPLTIRGAAADVAFAYYAGLGAKTRGGFGCPIVLA